MFKRWCERRIISFPAKRGRGLSPKGYNPQGHDSKSVMRGYNPQGHNPLQGDSYNPSHEKPLPI